MLHLHACKVAFILSEETSVEGFKPVADGDFALHKKHGVVALTLHENTWVYLRYGHAGHGDDLGNLIPIHFTLSQSPNGMNAVTLRDPDPIVRAFAVASMREDRFAEPAYIARKASGAFLQTNCEAEVLIEFWNTEHDAFISYLNEGFKPWMDLMLELDMLEFHLENLD